MGYSEKKKPLYRKVNTLARMVRHDFGGEYRYDRNTKQEKESESFGVTKQSMHAKVQRGLDYTPLFKFLLSKVGNEWSAVHSEALSRIDKEEPIFWLVARNEEEKEDVVRIGESSYYSGLYVDEQGILQKVNPDYNKAQDLITCNCCTFTLNGVVIPKDKNKNYSYY